MDVTIDTKTGRTSHRSGSVDRIRQTVVAGNPEKLVGHSQGRVAEWGNRLTKVAQFVGAVVTSSASAEE
jgi:hypothetical protein